MVGEGRGAAREGYSFNSFFRVMFLIHWLIHNLVPPANHSHLNEEKYIVTSKNHHFTFLLEFLKGQSRFFFKARHFRRITLRLFTMESCMRVNFIKHRKRYDNAEMKLHKKY